MSINRIYYQVKPFIPRTLQIILRREVVRIKRKSSKKIWPIDGNAGEKPKDWIAWPSDKKIAIVLMHDVDNEGGYNKCHQLMQIEEELGFRSSFDFVPARYTVSPELRKELVKKGFEVAVHG